MKKALLCAVVLVLLLSTGAWATVICNGSKCGGTGIRDYIYEVSFATTFGYLQIGTCDGNINDYTSVLTPNGWTFNIVEATEANAELHDIFSPHGTVQQTPVDKCPYLIVWASTDVQYDVSAFVFGYNNSNAPHDADWTIGFADDGDWTMALGMGEGVVHSPSVPEPGSFFALAAGLLGLAGLKLKIRR
ncbi:PEP-CTERM sorting domain-containing protein [bacterium]|nr:PEP-CTERM sorting domain-containing protein [bacterium]